MRILYIGGQILKPKNGGDMIENRNQRLLERITKGNVTYMNPESLCSSSFSYRIGIGISNVFLQRLYEIIHKEKFDLVFVSQSIYGRCTRFLKKANENIPIATFFHNAESDFFYELYKSDKTLRKFLYYKKARYWEKCSTRYSDCIITLNERDSQRLKAIYGRNGDFILPTTFRDSYIQTPVLQPDIDYLFLGSSFFANIEAVQFFLDNVLPFIPGFFCVAGKDMDKVGFKNINNRVQILGFVDNLNEIYARSRFIVSPIFSGSGMKTKTAEALMFGKLIIGTKEAFEGYEINKQCMIECNSAQEYIRTLKKLYNSELPIINEHARNHFLMHYDDECVIQDFQNLLYKLCQ